MIISPDNSTSNQVQQSMASTRSAGNQEQENLPSVSAFQFEQQIEERRKGEAEANGGLASGTLHYLDNQGSSGGAMQERLNIVPVQFLEGERVKLSRTNGDH